MRAHDKTTYVPGAHLDAISLEPVVGRNSTWTCWADVASSFPQFTFPGIPRYPFIALFESNDEQFAELRAV